jgi:hypothetical protein
MKMDGCYHTLDNTVMVDLIQADFAEQGLGRRWKEHLRASHLTDRSTRGTGHDINITPMSLAPNRVKGHCISAPAKNGHGN